MSNAKRLIQLLVQKEEMSGLDEDEGRELLELLENETERVRNWINEW